MKMGANEEESKAALNSLRRLFFFVANKEPEGSVNSILFQL